MTKLEREYYGAVFVKGKNLKIKIDESEKKMKERIGKSNEEENGRLSRIKRAAKSKAGRAVAGLTIVGSAFGGGVAANHLGNNAEEEMSAVRDAITYQLAESVSDELTLATGSEELQPELHGGSGAYDRGWDVTLQSGETATVLLDKGDSNERTIKMYVQGNDDGKHAGQFASVEFGWQSDEDPYGDPLGNVSEASLDDVTQVLKESKSGNLTLHDAVAYVGGGNIKPGEDRFDVELLFDSDRPHVRTPGGETREGHRDAFDGSYVSNKNAKYAADVMTNLLDDLGHNAGTNTGGSTYDGHHNV